MKRALLTKFSKIANIKIHKLVHIQAIVRLRIAIGIIQMHRGQIQATGKLSLDIGVNLHDLKIDFS